MSAGIIVRHARSCKTKAAGCKCKPSYRAWVYDKRAKKKIQRTFRNLSEAKSWRADAMSQLGKGTMSSPSKLTVREAGEALIEGMRSGSVRNRKGEIYKPSAVRGYEAALRDRIYPVLGAIRFSDVQRRDVQRIADEMLAERRDASTIRNALMPLRVIFRRAVQRGEVAVNPTTGIELPAVLGKRDRIASPEEAQAFITALPQKSDQALWAMAFYSGLRAGEIMALAWENVDLAKGVIRVERSYDPKEGVYTKPKSKAGKRTVPIPAALRDYLIEHKLRSGRSEGLVFERDTNAPRRAQRIWKRARLGRITLHEARHTYASLMIAAGVNAKALSTYMGHSSVTITYDRYGHLMPGNEDEAAALLDAYLERANTKARLAQVEG